MPFYIVYVTSPNKKEAVQLSKNLIQQKIAACVNIIDSVTSIYNWNNQLQEDSEVILLIKTKEENFKEIQRKIIKFHSYETPCILKIDIKDGNENYLNWLNDNCT